MLYIYLCAYAASPSALHTNNFLFHYKANTYENAYYVICIKKARPLTFHIYVPCAGVLQSHTSCVNRRKKDIAVDTQINTKVSPKLMDTMQTSSQARYHTIFP